MADEQSRRLPFLDSYRNRYATLSLVLTIALVAIAWFGYTRVEATSYQQIDRITQRDRVSTILSNIQADGSELLETLQNVVIMPDESVRQQVPVVIKRLDLGIKRLQGETQELLPGMRLVATEMHKDLKELDFYSASLIRVRMDENRWLPAGHLMQDELLPRFMSSLTILEAMAQELEDEPGFREREALHVVNECRLGWVRMTAELRLFVANRFGVFSTDSEVGMAARHDNVLSYADTLKSQLEELVYYASRGWLGFNDVTTINQLLDNYQGWVQAMEELVQTMQSGDWRRDLTKLRDEIRPLLERFQQRITAMQVELDIQSARDITGLTDTARKLSWIIVAITGSVVLVLLGGYFSFSRLMLKPIADTTRALTREASGEPFSLEPSSYLRETRDLADAFHKMRDQVQERQLRLDYMAHHDALTGLPNRVFFNQQLRESIRQALKHEQQVALMFLDLDRFKQINDTLGHAIGDELLQQVAQRLADADREAMIARFGGDEFAITVRHINGQIDAVNAAERVLHALKAPFHVQDQVFHVTTSIGVAMAPADATTVGDLVRAADAAMYEAKRNGRNGYWFYNKEMSRQSTDRLLLEGELRQAIDSHEFEIYYQPIVTLTKQQIIGFECLLRWNHPDKGVLAPAAFLEVLDETGLIKDITLWLVRQVESMQAALSDAGAGDLMLSINLSARLLQDERFALRLSDEISALELDPNKLIIELTEDALADHIIGAGKVLREFRQRGMHIAVDDFGTGQSSLVHLRTFQFDILKIDKTFIRDVIDDPEDASLVRAIIQLGKSFGMRIVAEGVETTEQREFLMQHRCDCMQGYLVSRPMPAANVLEFVRSYSGDTPSSTVVRLN